MQFKLKPGIAFGLTSLSLIGLAALPASAQVANLSAQVNEYGTENQCGAGAYGFDPKAGATLSGLTAGQMTAGTQSQGHTEFIPNPASGDFAGTDTIHVGSTFTNQAHDGYSGQYLYPANATVIKGPDVFALDYSSLIPTGQVLKTLTLGIAADDFQAPKYGQPFTATINGQTSAALTDKLNSVTLTDPSNLFFTVGIDPALLNGSKTLNLSIDEGGDGGDGYAVDFLTVGVTTGSTPLPEASSTVSLGLLLMLGLGGVAIASRKKKVVTAN